MNIAVTPADASTDDPLDTQVDDLSRALGLVRRHSVDPAGRATVEYEAGLHMCHSGGVVQGGFVSGWLDSAMAHAVMARNGMEMTPMSLELKVSFFAPARPGRVFAEAWIEKADGARASPKRDFSTPRAWCSPRPARRSASSLAPRSRPTPAPSADGRAPAAWASPGAWRRGSRRHAPGAHARLGVRAGDGAVTPRPSSSSHDNHPASLTRTLALAPAALGVLGPSRLFAQVEDPFEGQTPPNVFYSPCGRPYRAKAGAPYPVIDWFSQADADHDNRLEHDEFVADAMAFFKILDRNGDGVISPQEVTFYEQRIAPEVLGMRVEGALYRMTIDQPRLWRVQGMPGNPMAIDPNPDAGTDDRSLRPKPYDASGKGAAPYGFFDEPEPVTAADVNFRGLISKPTSRLSPIRTSRRSIPTAWAT